MNISINSSQNTNKTALAGQASSNAPVLADQPQKTTLNEAVRAIGKLRGFIGRAQLAAIGEMLPGQERQYFLEKMVELAGIVESMPTTYQTDGQGGEAVAWLHYFTSGADFYITERDCERDQLQAFGKADLGYGGEIGYINIVEILSCGAQLDLHWQPRKLSEI